MKKFLLAILLFFLLSYASFAQTKESQMDSAYRQTMELESKLEKDVDGNSTTDSIEKILKPIAINSLSEITDDKLIDPGKMYYFKLRAIYKGFDRNAKRIVLQNIPLAVNNLNSNILANITTDLYPVRVGGDFNSTISSICPKDSNMIATFYVYAIRITDVAKESGYFVRFIKDITTCPLKKENFIIMNGLGYITPESVTLPTTQNMISNMVLSNLANDSYFDPLLFSFVDMMDARGAMNKKKTGDDSTFPTIPIKFSSDVIFQGQSGTTLTFSTDDLVLTEYMNFIGRATSISKGQKVRIYYTIAKDPLEKWDVKAIEKL